MANIMDYLSWRGDLTFDKDEFNEVDNLILSELVYLEFDGYVPTYPSKESAPLNEVLKNFFHNHPVDTVDSGMVLGKDPALLGKALITTPRFMDLEMISFVNRIDVEKHEQFSAVSYRISKDLIYIAYKGTDDSIIGWQEDLDMIATFPVPAQTHALHYIDTLMKHFPKAKFILGGHSKGGNLAVYASLYCQDEFKKRIQLVYSNDGPGFDRKLLDKKKLARMQRKFVQIVPEDCIIGNLFEHIIHKRIIVKSADKGLMDHSGFNWLVISNHFEKAPDGLQPKSKKVDRAIKKLLKNIDSEQKYKLTRSLYNVVISSKQNTLTQLKSDASAALSAAFSLDSSSRSIFFKLIGIFIMNRAF